MEEWDAENGKGIQTYGERVAFHVREFYSPARVNSTAKWMGAIPGMSFYMTTVDPDDGQPWDFNNQEKAFKAEEIIKTRRTLLLIGSPMCAAFSQLQSLNFRKMNPEELAKLIEYGSRHLEWCVDLYNTQRNM